MKIIRTVKEMQEASDAFRREGKKIGFVPTMGYLHEGHLALVRKARELADVVVASIFVNPIQFGPKEDLSRYPRDFERDRALLEREGTDVLFFPDVSEMYPEGYSTYVEVKELEDHLCGLSRQGSLQGSGYCGSEALQRGKAAFRGLRTERLSAVKDDQRMVKDLNMDVEIVGLPDGERGRGARHELQERLPERRRARKGAPHPRAR